MRLTNLKSLVTVLFMACGFAAKSDVTLAWNPVSGNVTNYMLYWGTNTGVYLFGVAAGLQTTYTVTGLTPGSVYYFAVTAQAADGTQSLDSNEAVYTNTTVTPPSLPGTNGGSTGGGTMAGGGSGGSGGSGGTNNSNTINTNSGEIAVVGIPPVLGLTFNSAHHPVLNITGTVGATFNLLSSTNPASLASWNIFTNQTMTNALGPTNSGSASVINLAYVPASQTYEVIDSNPPTSEFYKMAMPYDYMVLADANLTGQGYPSRLVLVRMPGVSADDVCYVTNQSSFIHYDTTNHAFSIEPSGGTIRQIASTLATSLGQNWTSASEFGYSNGVSTILATVVETEPPGSDPVAGQSTPSIAIDF